MLMRIAGSWRVKHTTHGQTVLLRHFGTLHLVKGVFKNTAYTPRLRKSARVAAICVRQASSRAAHGVKDVAILGGGITGLAAAHYIVQELPHAKVTIYESKSELGGWLRSKTVDVGDGEVIFESGPRSLRPTVPNGTLTMRLVEQLGLVDDLLVTPRSSPAARNRYIYYPDRLVRMPAPGRDELFHNFRTIFREPVFTGFVEKLAEGGVFGPRPHVPEDESIGEFVSKRIGEQATNNLVSALYHGIYAGDIWQLSAKSVLGVIYEREKRHESLWQAFYDVVVKNEAWVFADDTELQTKLNEYDWNEEMKQQMRGASVFTFEKGVGQLADALEESLLEQENVSLARDTVVTSIQKVKDSEDICISSQPANIPPQKNASDHTTATTHTHVISTLRGPLLTRLLAPPDPSSTSSLASSSSRTTISTSPTLLPPATTTALTSIPTVTVCVVNLYFRTPHLLQTLTPSIRGFGYLIPSTVPLSENPERALGVIFDSDISPSLHTTLPAETVGTRLTVMLGGHWWDGWTAYPDEEDSIAMARLLLERHLGITEEPAASTATLQRDCISQYTVGHARRMGEAHVGLAAGFGGRVRVAGSAWGVAGVGVNDCVRGAWDVVQGLVEGGVRGRSRTGLERFREGRPMVRVKRRKGELLVIGMDDDVRRLGYFKDS